MDRYPPEGEYCIAAAEIELPGGTSTNTAITLARLGARPRFVGVVGDDWRGERLRAGLEAAGVICDTLGVRVGQDSDRSIIPISPSGGRTIFWIKGAVIAPSDAIDLPLIFSHPIVYLDIVDLTLWSSILDARAQMHADDQTRARVVGQAVYVAGILPPNDALALVARHDVFVGGEWEWKLITGESDRPAMIARIASVVAETGSRIAVVTQGAEGCTVITADQIETFPAAAVNVVDTTGAGDAFAAGIIFGLLRNWEIARCAQFANAVGALATRALGSQASLPTLAEAHSLAFGIKEA